jgi:hypothetical protein
MRVQSKSCAHCIVRFHSHRVLMRLEVERIEVLLAGAAKPCGLAQPLCSEMIEAKNRMGETA